MLSLYFVSVLVRLSPQTHASTHAQANLTVSTDVRQCGVLPPFAKFAHLVVAVERATSPLAQQAKRATSARLQAQRDHQAQLAAKAAADAVAAAAQEKTFAALWKDGREEWEKHLGPDACFKLGLPPPSLTSPSAGTGEEGSATALAARGLPPGTASSAAEEKASKEDEDEQAAVLASSILGPRAACYTKIVASLFAGLERAANANDKYKDVCRLENYAFFADAVNAATNRSAREQQRKKRTLQDSSSSDKHGHGDDHDAGRSISRLELWHELDTAVADAREQYSINLARCAIPLLVCPFFYSYKCVAAIDTFLYLNIFFGHSFAYVGLSHAGIWTTHSSTNSQSWRRSLRGSKPLSQAVVSATCPFICRGSNS